jgi:carbamoyl-phosphate synthase large subunit
MPKRQDLRKILILGSGPIVIGQACEFDYSGVQACKALRAEGYEVVLVNSNPATIMTDPEFADRTYIEPLTVEYLTLILERERPQAVLPTVGGQTAINAAVALAESGVLERLGVELIGAKLDALRVAEDRRLFRDAMKEIGLDVPESDVAASVEEALEIAERTGFPAILRPSFTLGGAGGGIAYNVDELRELSRIAIERSPVGQVLVESSLLGWKEYELEVMRDVADNVVIICSIENFDPMGVHTGDSITVAPAQTLTDREYQVLRDASARIIRRVGVDTGGSNVQFAVNPADGRVMVIEMNPRVSRSSALASKATGFPIAKIAAKLAVGYTLDEIPNDITKMTPACFEPTIDYVVTKIPRFAFEKFPGSSDQLGTQMKSVGEAMAMGRTFKESFQKALRSLEIGRAGFGADGKGAVDPDRLKERLITPSPERIFYIHHALCIGMSVAEIAGLTHVDPWFLENLRELVVMAEELKGRMLASLPAEELRAAKAWGFSDRQLAWLCGTSEAEVRRRRWELGIRPVYKRVDTCAGEFKSSTPYMYSTYDAECEAEPTAARKIMILGGGPNRIGQGIEFDYCCVHAVMALRELGYETIMVNCNPETVSTDYDTSDRLYFEPLTLEDVLEIVEVEKPEGVLVQFGGQTPLRLAVPLREAGVKVLGTSPDSIDLAEDRQRFGELLHRLDIRQPRGGTARTLDAALKVARDIGYPVLVRPSYVLGGRAMAIVYGEHDLERFWDAAAAAAEDFPVLIDEFLEDAFEADVDAVGDGERILVAGVMQHIESAGIHSGDSACVLPPYKLDSAWQEQMRRWTAAMGKALGVVGLMNVQFAVKDGQVYVLEVNPRASRTVPYVSKATGVAWAKVAARAMAGRSLASQGVTAEVAPRAHCIKEAIFPFIRFPGTDPVLLPEMRSTGEVMGISDSFGGAFAKAQVMADNTLPVKGVVFISVNDGDKPAAIGIARDLQRMGFGFVATRGTWASLEAAGIRANTVFKVNEGRPSVVDLMVNGGVQLVINTPLGRASQFDETAIRKAALPLRIPLITTMSGARAAVDGIRVMLHEKPGVISLQELHAPGRGMRGRA